MQSTIPVIDHQVLQGSDSNARAEQIQRLGEGLEKFGFFAVTNHGIGDALLESCYEAAANVFAQPSSVKQQYERPDEGRQRGYTSFGVEHAKDSDLVDQKEFWQVGRELAEGHPLRVQGLVPENLWPTEVPAFREAYIQYFEAMESLSLELLDGLADYLQLDHAFFRDMVRDGNTVLRTIHYPSENVLPGSVRAAAHEDINLITLLPASTQPGLELMTREGDWMPVVTPPGVIVCDTGDMMAHQTAGRFPGTTHRVVNPDQPDGGRQSLPFFVHPRPDFVLKPFDPSYGDEVRADEFLRRRLIEIGVL